MSDLPDRFWANVEKTDGCWLWTGRRNRKGYGYFYDSGTQIDTTAHRVAHELVVGPIPERHEIDHLCRVTSCVRPDHLESVTPAENRRRQEVAYRGEVDACRAGHLRTAENTYIVRRIRRGKEETERRCRECVHLRYLRSRERAVA